MHYDEPLTCDVTAYIKAAAGKIVGFTIDMVASEDSSREPVRFWSREMDDPAVQSIDYRGAPLSPDSARSFDDPPAAMESGEKDVFEVRHVVSCRAVPCRAVSCRVLPCRAVPCPVLSCPGLSCVYSTTDQVLSRP